MTQPHSPAGPANPISPENYFREMLQQGRFMLQRCTESGKAVFYPRVVSPYSGRATLEWIEASGRGTVYATTTVRRKPERGGDYNVALIDLAEGARMMSRVVGIASSEVRIGMPVGAEIVSENSDQVIVFRPLASA